MNSCVSMLKPINGICQHNENVCMEEECINWVDREYYDPSKKYPYGTLRIGDKRTMFTTGGWKELKDCKPDFRAWGVERYAIKIVHIKEEECGMFEKFDRTFSNIERLVRNIQTKKLEKQWNPTNV